MFAKDGPQNQAVLDQPDSDREILCEIGELFDYPFGIERIPLSHFLASALLRIRGRNGELLALRPNAIQQRYEQHRTNTNIVLKARQVGITTWVAGRFFLKTITKPGTLTLQVAHTQNAAEALFGIVRRFYENLPDNLRRGVLKTTHNSCDRLVFPVLGSEYRVASASDRNVGRGITIQNLHCSEIAHWTKDAAGTMAALRAATSPEAEICLESTPNGAQGYFWNEWIAAEANGVTKHFFPWWLEKAYVANQISEESMSSDEQYLVTKYGLTRGQIGYRRKIRSAFGKRSMQEYPENAIECFLNSGESVFDSNAVMLRLAELNDPYEIRMNGALEVYYPPVENRDYLVSVDPAGGGISGDWSAAQVVDISTGMQCAELMLHAGGYELAQKVVSLAREYGDALVVVERNNHGAGILAYLEQGSCRYDHVYEQGGSAGWLTTRITRNAALARLEEVLMRSTGLLNSRRLLEECRSFIRLPSGRTGAAADSHDDCVMSMAIGLAVRNELTEN